MVDTLFQRRCLDQHGTDIPAPRTVTTQRQASLFLAGHTIVSGRFRLTQTAMLESEPDTNIS
jgi:hypothetical protein